MKKLLLIASAWLALATYALAQTQTVTQPSNQAATNFSSTIAVTNTFQSVLAASTKRQGCSIQNNGANSMWVYFGPIANATKATSFVLGAGQGITCGSEGVVAKDQVSITGTATDTFAATQDGAPTVGPSSTVNTGGGGTDTNVNVDKWGGAATTLGQKTMAASVPVVVASDQASFPVTIAAGAAVIGKVGIDQTTPGNTNGVQIVASTNVTTLTTAITRPTDTNAYAANDALANSTSAPTAGGFTLTSACRASGGNGTIQSANISASAGTLYQGEIWVFDQAVTATNDNAALSVSDADIQNLVGVIPFATTDVNAANTISYVTGLNIGYTCVGTANLRFLVKINTAITPASAEVLAVRVQVQN